MMLCLADRRSDHLAAAARWKKDQETREHQEWFRELKAELLAANALRKNPNPVCRNCGTVQTPQEMDFLLPSLCTTCGLAVLEALVRRIIRRRGRVRTIKRLCRLGR